jgi:hypothetical protein
VKLKGSLLSLQKSDDFVDETVEVTFREKNQSSENVTIRNLTQITQSRKLCPRYTGTPKHDSSLKGTAPSVKGTPMDLTIEEAQEVLNHSIDYKKNAMDIKKKKTSFMYFIPITVMILMAIHFITGFQFLILKFSLQLRKT